MSADDAIGGRGGAGEGTHLPKGLSLFRFFLFAGLMLGAVYGGLSLQYATPPPLGYVSSKGAMDADGGAGWRPSWLWVPACLSIKVGIGVERSGTGYAIRNRRDGAFFAMSVMALGILLGGTVGWVLGEWVRKRRLRRRRSSP